MLDVWRSIVGELIEHDALLVLGKGLGAFEITVRPLLFAALAVAARTPLAARIRRAGADGRSNAQARFLAIHAAPSSLVLLINSPKSVQARLELRHRAEVHCHSLAGVSCMLLTAVHAAGLHSAHRCNQQ